MQPEKLYNQLRFNLGQPYDINKLSVRHKNPKPITIEKAGRSVDVPNISTEESFQLAEEALNSQFSSLNLAKLKEAQFLAQRQLKKEKDSSLLGVKSSSPKKSTKQTASQRPLHVKVAPTKKLDHLPRTGSSPPVRDISSKQTKTKPFGATYHRKGPQKKSPAKPKKSSNTPAGDANTKYSNGILQEKLETDRQAFDVPDVHKMAMEQLLKVKAGDLTTPACGPMRRQTPSSTRRRKAAPGRRSKFTPPSRRAELARAARERIYRQPLVRGLPASPKASARTKGRVLHRQPAVPQYDPDYNYVDPDSHLNNSIHIKPPPNQKSHDLPNAEEFIARIAEARRANEEAERYAAAPNKWLDRFEKETRARLEPLIQQAEAISENMRSRMRQGKGTTVHTVTPQYNGGHENREMSADDLLQHPVSSELIASKQTSASASQPKQEVDDAGEAAIDSSCYISTEDRHTLHAMLSRLDEMEREHVEIRHRWLTVSNKYSDTGIVSLDDKPEAESCDAGNTMFEAPRPVLLKKTQSQESRPKTIPVGGSSSAGLIHSQMESSHPHSHHDSSSAYPGVVLSLPEKKVTSIQNGKKRYEKHLENTGHTISAGFNPWKFAQQTADEILDTCIAQVSKELIDIGDGIVQTLYSDEFIAAKHHSVPNVVTAT